MPRLAAMFLAFASRKSSTLPIDTPVRLYLGNKYEKTLPDGVSGQRSRWRVCDVAYGEHPYPVSATAVADNYGVQRMTAHPATDGCLATLSSTPTDTGGPTR
jgi:hypothetical protein